MKLNKRVFLRINENDKEKLREVANLLNIPMSRFIIKTALSKAEEILKENKENE